LKFWDSSALLPLLAKQPASARVEELIRQDPEVVLWWGTPVECASGLARLHREGLPASNLRKAHGLLDHLHSHAYEIQPGEEVRAGACSPSIACAPPIPSNSLRLSSGRGNVPRASVSSAWTTGCGAPPPSRASRSLPTLKRSMRTASRTDVLRLQGPGFRI
jgi:hypothetical protein